MSLGKWAKPMGFYCLVFAIFSFSVFPLYYAIISSLKTGSALFHPSLWVEVLDLTNYIAVFSNLNFGTNILNSLIVATSVVILSLLLSVTASFALGRIQFRGRNLILISILSVSMFPSIAVLTGLFELLRSIGLYNSLPGLILSYMIFTLPFTVWVLTTFVKQIPHELEEAAIVDGASSVTIIWHIFFPLMAPAIVTTGLLAFITAWNEFLFALTFAITDDKRTVPVAIAMMSGGGEHEIPWGMINAGSVIVTIPLIVLVLIFQKRIVSGLTVGGVKG
ncbi:carbohydrate ABC transporter permease [Vibrio kyushuensis]|uniref:carbohydrate ABC transporter permease n=1 Tax=Vibrio kyushuensis TaxID=2910249 RepID=UPI003D0ABD86